MKGAGSYTWESTDRLVTDVQGWLDDPAGNVGWLLLGDESQSRSAKRFDSRNHDTEQNRPVLVVNYVV
ncbi:MAG: hypothetical protein CL732_00540 [Chloroflexi bacterium]|nr:hypothetical protein [Chloroflexota bacterium]